MQLGALFCLVGWLAGWLVGCLVGWLVGGPSKVSCVEPVDFWKEVAGEVFCVGSEDDVLD